VSDRESKYREADSRDPEIDRQRPDGITGWFPRRGGGRTDELGDSVEHGVHVILPSSPEASQIKSDLPSA
jgi:hypothetical protein